jgi:hypothetical protein
MSSGFAPLPGGAPEDEEAGGWKKSFVISAVGFDESAKLRRKIFLVSGGCAALLTFVLACVALSTVNDLSSTNSAEISRLQKQVRSLESSLAKDEEVIASTATSVESVQSMQSLQASTIASLTTGITDLTDKVDALDCTDSTGELPGGEIKEYNGHYYQLVTTTFTYADQTGTGVTFHDAQLDAAARCHGGQRGYLATIGSEEEQAFLQGLIPSGYFWHDWSAWIGASDAADEGTWRWIGGPEQGQQFWKGESSENGGYPTSPAGVQDFTTFTHWYCKSVVGYDFCEPNAMNEYEDCAQMFANGYWNDASCWTMTPGFFVEYGADE